MEKLTQNALTVLKARYLLKDQRGKTIETPEAMFRRVAFSIAQSEATYGEDPLLWEQRFFDLMSSLRFLPNSPALMNAGKPDGQLAACFVLPVDDSMQGIFGTLRDAALILKSGGGTGFSFSRLRPSADMVKSTGGIASGPVSFMRIYNTATDVIKQGGARRGANMGILRVDHPDILEFIRLKRDIMELENFNTSVAVTDAFMRALKAGKTYRLRHPKPDGKLKHASLSAPEVFRELVHSAWETGDPGVVFIDRINRANPTPQLGEIESTNPCGEQPLLPYEACVLGSLNLARFVVDGKLDYKGLADAAGTAVRLLDDSIDASKYPLPEIERMHKGNRKIGLGVMGFADMLILMGIPYDSEEAIKTARKVMGFIQRKAREASVALARKRGAFLNIKGSIYDKPGIPAPRNATVTTVAPTGTISIIADCSNGIEPLFALAFRRKALGTEMLEVHRIFFDIARARGILTPRLEREIVERGSLENIDGIPSDIKRLMRTAHEISPRQHIRMQAAFQRYTDNAVSKTINMPQSSRVADVERAFVMAYDMGCKGITVFRHGSAKQGALEPAARKSKSRSKR